MTTTEKQVSGGPRYANKAVSQRLNANTPARSKAAAVVATAAMPEAAAGEAIAKKVGPRPESQDTIGGPAPVASNASTPPWAIPDSVVFLTGLGLIVVSALTSGQLAQLGQEIWNGKSTLTKSDFVMFGGEFLFVAIASFMAKVSPDIGNLVFTLFMGLWLVWAINNQSLLVKWRDTLLASQVKK